MSSGSRSDQTELGGERMDGTTDGTTMTLCVSGCGGSGSDSQRCNEDIVGVLASDGIVPISSNASAVAYTDGASGSTTSGSDASEAVR